MIKSLRKLIVTVLGCLSLVLSGCVFSPAKPKIDFAISDSSLVLTQGEEGHLSVSKLTIDGEDIKNYRLLWSSDNTAVATIDGSGTITTLSVGSARIKAAVTTTNYNSPITAFCSLTVVPKESTFTIDPSEVVLNLKNTKTATLSAYFDGKITKSVLWSTDNVSVVNVNTSGYVTGKNIGSATITATYTNDVSFKAICHVEVVNSDGVIDSVTVTPKTATLDVSKSEKVQLSAVVTGSGDFRNTVTWKSSDPTIAKVDNTGFVTAVSKGTATIVATATDAVHKDSCEITVTDSRPVTISLDKTTASVGLGRNLQLNASVSHAADKSVTWVSNNSQVTVSSTGLVSVSDTATVGSSAKITATSVEDPTKSASCVITIIEKPDYKYDYTIMLYMCGSSLENDGTKYSAYPGLLSEDIKEILSVNLPDDVKVIIETGGTTKWALGSSYIDGATSISSTALQRWEVSNKKIKLIETLSTNHMASKESYQSFLEWGLTDYDAEQMGVIISGHGAGIDGCAPDDNYTYSYGGQSFRYSLEIRDIVDATDNALEACDRSKFTWMGFDCCLMQCADTASVLADYFDFMVASQETELGEGWDHDTYLKKLVTNTRISPEELLPVIASSFVQAGHDKYCSSYEYCLQTLSVLDLRNMDAFVEAFNNYVDKTGTSAVEYSKYKSAFENAYNSFGEEVYGLADLKDFFTKLKSQFSTVSIDSVLDAIDDLVLSNSYCSRYSVKPCGLNAFFPVSLSSRYALQPSKDDYIGTLVTKFTSYQTMCLTYGEWAW